MSKCLRCFPHFLARIGWTQIDLPFRFLRDALFFFTFSLQRPARCEGYSECFVTPLRACDAHIVAKGVGRCCIMLGFCCPFASARRAPPNNQDPISFSHRARLAEQTWLLQPGIGKGSSPSHRFANDASCV